MESFFPLKRPWVATFRPFFRSHGYDFRSNFPLRQHPACQIFQKGLLPRGDFSRRNAFNSPHARPCPTGPGCRSDVSRYHGTVFWKTLSVPGGPHARPCPTGPGCRSDVSRDHGTVLKGTLTPSRRPLPLRERVLFPR